MSDLKTVFTAFCRCEQRVSSIQAFLRHFSGSLVLVFCLMGQNVKNDKENNQWHLVDKKLIKKNHFKEQSREEALMN